MRYLFICSLLIFTLVSCGQKDKYREDYGTIADARLIVSNQHVGGYGRSQCLLCHNAELNIHRRGQNGLDPNMMAELAKTNGLSAYCKTCHTGNGL